MTPRTRNAAHAARAAADLSHVTDRRTDTANIGKNSQHLMHSMQPNDSQAACLRLLAEVAIAVCVCHANTHSTKTVIFSE